MLGRILCKKRSHPGDYDSEPATRAIRSFNEQLYQDDRVSISMVPIGDGLTLAYKK